MVNNKTTRDLGELDRLKREFGGNQQPLLRVLRSLAKSSIDDAESLIRFHEALLFLCAYPPSPSVLELAEQILKSFKQRISQLMEGDIDLSALDDPEVSGIAGGSVDSNFSYAVVRWLADKFPRQLSIDWDWFEEEDRFGATMPRFLPLLADDAMVEAHVPYHEWLEAARGRQHELSWLMKRFGTLASSDKQRAELYDALKLHVIWHYGERSSRTSMRGPRRKTFIHNQALIQRRDVSLTAELSSPPVPVRKCSEAEGQRALEMARETSAVRYRELHGFTYGDPRRVLRAELGRGVEAFVTGVPPENRLPLRAYHAALILKNSVPVAYFEGLSIFERMESGFNLYYTFRDGETAWLYARILRLMRQLLGVTVFSIDPYQVGHENEEGIESGAFWFYRKLGFRPVKPELLKLTEQEERKMREETGYRTSARTLRRLAAGHMLFELPAAKNIARRWDAFASRNLGLNVQRRMAQKFNGDPDRLGLKSTEAVEAALGIKSGSWSTAEKTALANISLVLALEPEISRWSDGEKELMATVIRAKAAPDESVYLQQMQKHAALRDVFIRFGSDIRR